jgi:small neutral amino acid transporter SnatA (MarC family)
MGDFPQTLLGIFAAVAPFGALPVFARLAEREPGVHPPLFLALVALCAFAALAAAALVADPFLDWLDVTPENFQFAAAVIMSPLAIRLLVFGTTMGLPGDGSQAGRLAWAVPLGVPLVAGPAALAAAMSYGTRFGIPEVLAAAALVVVFTAALFFVSDRAARLLRGAGMDVLARLSGALLVVIAVELAIDGVRSV